VCVQNNPKSVVHSVSHTAGGVINAKPPRQLPGDEKQTSNFKNKEKQINVFGVSKEATAGNLFVVIQQAYSEDPSNKFVSAVNAAPEPAVVFATDDQLNDIVCFCTSSYDFCILTVDPTFSLGGTLITYRHLLLQSKRFQ